MTFSLFHESGVDEAYVDALKARESLRYSNVGGGEGEDFSRREVYLGSSPPVLELWEEVGVLEEYVFIKDGRQLSVVNLACETYA